MSRQVFHTDNRLTVIHGHDHLFGEFYQIFDNAWINETQEGEGLVFDWDEFNGASTNLTGIHLFSPLELVQEYIKYNKEDTEDIDEDKELYT